MNDMQKMYIDMFETKVKMLVELEEINKSLQVYTSQNPNGQTLDEIYRNDIITNDRKSFYENQSYNTLQDWFKLFLYIYIFVALITLYAVWNAKYETPLKVAIGVVTIIFPISLYFVVGPLLYWMSMLNNILPKNVNFSP